MITHQIITEKPANVSYYDSRANAYSSWQNHAQPVCKDQAELDKWLAEHCSFGPGDCLVSHTLKANIIQSDINIVLAVLRDYKDVTFSRYDGEPMCLMTVSAGAHYNSTASPRRYRKMTQEEWDKLGSKVHDNLFDRFSTALHGAQGRPGVPKISDFQRGNLAPSADGKPV